MTIIAFSTHVSLVLGTNAHLIMHFQLSQNLFGTPLITINVALVSTLTSPFTFHLGKKVILTFLFYDMYCIHYFVKAIL